jgi:DNA mismatch repair ATPase MutS
MGCDGTMLIDSQSIANLEVIFNLRTGDKTDSLFGILNHTKTALGGKAL